MLRKLEEAGTARSPTPTPVHHEEAGNVIARARQNLYCMSISSRGCSRCPPYIGFNEQHAITGNRCHKLSLTYVDRTKNEYQLHELSTRSDPLIGGISAVEVATRGEELSA